MVTCSSHPVLGVGRRILFATLLASSLRAGYITVNPPTATGTVDLKVTVPGLPDPVTFSVKIDSTKIKTAAQKQKAIFDGFAAQKDKFGNNLIPNLGEKGDNTVTADGSKIEVTGDDTAEGNILTADLGWSLPGSPAYASLGFTGPINALGTDGNMSFFSASFGVDGTTLSSATVSYNHLSSPTDDALATALYDALLSGLDLGLRSDLHLDLSHDTITFDFPAGSGQYFVGTGTTSAMTSSFSSVSSTQTPEPFTSFTLGTGLILLGAAKIRPKLRLKLLKRSDRT